MTLAGSDKPHVQGAPAKSHLPLKWVQKKHKAHKLCNFYHIRNPGLKDPQVRDNHGELSLPQTEVAIKRAEQTWSNLTNKLSLFHSWVCLQVSLNLCSSLLLSLTNAPNRVPNVNSDPERTSAPATVSPRWSRTSACQPA